MAENQSKDSQEKTEEPTPKKKQDAKQKGQVPRSRELNTTVVLLAGSLTLMGMGENLGAEMVTIIKNSLTLDRELAFGSGAEIVGALTRTVIEMFALFIPYVILLMLIVLLSPVLIGGWSFSAKAMAPKMSKLSLAKGLKRIFSVRGLMELVKSMAKVLLVGTIATVYIWHYSDELLILGEVDYHQAIGRAIYLVAWLFVILSVATLIIAAIDIPFQMLQHTKELRMSKQEIRDEHKQTEGNPEVKGRIRRLQQEMATSRMMQEIPKADVVVTNPTHFSIAIKYEDSKRGAPIIVAKGVDLIALRIKEIALQHNVTLFEAPPLARALYYTTEINAEIPVELYHAVAQVLAYVYQLKSNTDGIVRPESIDLPDEFSRYR